MIDESSVGLTIAVDLVHVFSRDTTNHALLNDLWVFSHNMLDSLKILHGDLSPVSKIQNSLPGNLPMAELPPKHPT